MTEKINKYYPWLILITILAGICLRLIGFSQSTFAWGYRRGDEPAAYHKAILYLSARDKQARQQPLSQDEQNALCFGSALLGAGGILPGPLQNVLLARGIQLTGDIEGAHLVTLLLHCLTILLVWHGTHVLLGKQVAFLTTVMTALFAWPVYYSFGMWHPHFIPVLASFVFWALALYHHSKHPVFAGLLGMFVALFFQFHLIAGFLLFFLLFYFLFMVERKTVFLLSAAGGVLLAIVLSYQAYLAYEFAHGFDNLRRLFDNRIQFFHPEMFKVFSNILVVGSAEISRLIPGRFPGYLDFYATYFGHFALAAPIILASLALPAHAYVVSFRESLGQLFRTRLRAWKETIRSRQDWFILAGWFFIPWIAYLLTRKYHELRFVSLDYPVMYAMFALALIRLNQRWKRNIVPIVFSVLVLFNVLLSLFQYDYSRRHLRKPPHLVFSLRYYDAVTRGIMTACKHQGCDTYSMEFNKEKLTRSQKSFFGGLLEHVTRTTHGRLSWADDARCRFRISARPTLPGYELVRPVLSVYLHRRLPP